jgi:hypothetical protein
LVMFLEASKPRLTILYGMHTTIQPNKTVRNYVKELISSMYIYCIGFLKQYIYLHIISLFHAIENVKDQICLISVSVPDRLSMRTLSLWYGYQ